MYDVCVIGLGPTGAVLANLLAQQGIGVLVLEREAKMYPLPRAIQFDDEVMRVFQAVGVADDLVGKTRITPGMRFVDPDGTLLLDWPRPQEITAHGWNASYRLHQPDLETLLRDKLKTQASAEVRTSCQMTSLSERADSVEITAQDRVSGATDTYQARFVVGCDGANSPVRAHLGGGMDDLGFQERWLVTDLVLKRPRPDLGDHSIQFCDPARPMTYCRNPGPRRRWEITLRDDEPDEMVTKADWIWNTLSRWITPDDAEIERQAVYTFRSQLARTWRKGRVMIAGDAAHLTPPFMGQGMCTGVRDASNLAWKLIAALQGNPDHADAVLDTYQDEREPHARAYVETAIRLGGLINSLDRDSALKLAGDGPGHMRTIAPALGKSALNNGDAEVTGRPAPQPNLRDGTRLDDLVGQRHLIVTRAPCAPIGGNALWLDCESHPELGEMLDQLGRDAVWIKPDRYVGAVANDADVLRTKLPNSLF